MYWGRCRKRMKTGKWIIDGKVPKMQEVRGGIQEVISVRQIFNSTLFVIFQTFQCFKLPNQIHSDNGADFINKLWVELFSKLKILHTRTPPYNPSSNIMERWHRTIVSILQTMGSEMQKVLRNSKSQWWSFRWDPSYGFSKDHRVREPVELRKL